MNMDEESQAKIPQSAGVEDARASHAAIHAISECYGRICQKLATEIASLRMVVNSSAQQQAKASSQVKELEEALDQANARCSNLDQALELANDVNKSQVSDLVLFEDQKKQLENRVKELEEENEQLLQRSSVDEADSIAGMCAKRARTGEAVEMTVIEGEDGHETFVACMHKAAARAIAQHLGPSFKFSVRVRDLGGFED
jgi:chromosome segregation ATPase